MRHKDAFLLSYQICPVPFFILDGMGPPVLIEIKMSKTLRPETGNVFQRLEKVFKGSRGIVLSMAEEELSLSRHVRMMPWWKFDPATL
jgi:hypothetical protein